MVGRHFDGGHLGGKGQKALADFVVELQGDQIGGLQEARVGRVEEVRELVEAGVEDVEGALVLGEVEELLGEHDAAGPLVRDGAARGAHVGAARPPAGVRQAETAKA